MVRKILTLLTLTSGIIGLVASSGAPAWGAAARPSASRAGARPPVGFTERTANVNGITVNYVRGGHGPTLVLLHGYPQTRYMWRAVMPTLAERFTVVAPDLRGAGGSSAPRSGYDKRTMAADLHGLLTHLGLDRDVNLVGHDIGTMVAYAYAAAHPTGVAKLALTEAPIPDETIYRFPTLTPQGPGFWNLGFFNVRNGLPERIIEGREPLWVERFIDQLAVQKERATEPAATREYASHLLDDARLRASFEWFRAFNRDVADNARYRRRPLPMPVLALGAEGSLGQAVPDQVRRYATSVRGGVIPNSGHWIFEEQPQETTRILLDFLGERALGAGSDATGDRGVPSIR